MKDEVEHIDKQQVELDLDLDPAINQRLNRKFDLHVIPFLFGIWYGRSTPQLRRRTVTDTDRTLMGTIGCLLSSSRFTAILSQLPCKGSRE